MALPDHLPPHVRAAILDIKARLAALYSDRLREVILYGSYARGDARPESDVDLLVVLEGPYEAYTEIKRMSILRLEAEIEHHVDISMQPYTPAEVANLSNPFMAAVAHDGCTL